LLDQREVPYARSCASTASTLSPRAARIEGHTGARDAETDHHDIDVRGISCNPRSDGHGARYLLTN
jgi:hypothetical protein